jgi:hypothetical protein
MLSAASRTSHSQARGSCCIDRLPGAIYAGPDEWVLDGRIHDQVDRPAEQILQGVTQVLMGRDPWLVVRKVSDEQIDIRPRGIEVQTPRSRPKHLQTVDVEPPAECSNVAPAHFDQWQHGLMVQSLTLDTLPQVPRECRFRKLWLPKRRRPHRPAAAVVELLNNSAELAAGETLRGQVREQSHHIRQRHCCVRYAPLRFHHTRPVTSRGRSSRVRAIHIGLTTARFRGRLMVTSSRQNVPQTSVTGTASPVAAASSNASRGHAARSCWRSSAR